MTYSNFAIPSSGDDEAIGPAGMAILCRSHMPAEEEAR